jgi:autotransporter-associated beta strand protein
LAIAAATASVAGLVSSRADAQTASPIGMTGWNVMDLYGVTPAAGATFVPFDDDFGYTWYPAGSPNPQGLPTSNNRTFASHSNGNTTFQFQPYDGTNNALELDSNSTGHMGQTLSQTLTLGNTTGYTSIAVLNAADSGGGTVNYSLNFAGGVTATGSFTSNDWFNGGAYAINSIGRVQLGSTAPYSNTGTLPALFENDITVPVADRGLALQSITFSVAAGGFKQYSVMAVSGARTVSPIAFSSGFTQKMIIPVGSGAGHTNALADVTASMDGGTGNPSANTWYEVGYNPGATTTGLPASGSTFTSQSDPSHSFQMQSYAGNNTVLLNNSITSDHMTLSSSSSAFSVLSFLTASGGGTGTFSLTIHYADGAPDTVINSVSSPDWFGNSPVAWTAGGRAVPTSGATNFELDGSNPRIYQEDVTLPDTIDPIASIDLNHTGGNGNTAVFAVSGNAVTALSYDGSDAVTPATFDTTSSNFKSGGSATMFSNGVVALFDDTASGSHTVTVGAGGVSPAGTVFNTSSSYTINGPGSITGIGSLTVNGSGTVTLNNSNTYSGNTLVNAGTLNIGATGSVASNNVTVASGAILSVAAGGQLTSSNLNLTDNGTVNLNSSMTVPTLNGSGALNLPTSGTTVTMNGGGFSGTVKGVGSTFKLNFSGNTFATFNGTLSDGTGGALSVALAKNAAWPYDIVLPNANSYSGGTTLQTGLVRVGNNNSLGSGPITFAGGTVGSSGPVTISNSFVFDQTNGISIDVFNPITFTTNIALAAGTTPVTAIFADVSSSQGQLAGVISGPGALNLTGYFAMTGTNSYQGGTTVNSGTDVATNNASAFGSGTITFNDGGIGTMASTPTSGFTIPNNFNFGATASAFFENYHSFIMSGNGNLGTGGTFFVYVPTVTLSGVISGGSLTLGAGSNVLELSNSGNTFSGPITVAATNQSDGPAGTVQIDNPGALGNVTSITVNNGGSFLVNDNSGTAGLVGVSQTPATANLTGAGVNGNGALRGADGVTSTWAGNINLAGGATISSGKDGTFVLTGSIGGSGPAVFKGNSGDVGAGATIILSPAAGKSNTYTGETQATGSTNIFEPTTLQLGADNGISPNSGLNIVVGSSRGPVFVDLNGHNQGVTYLTGAAMDPSAIMNSGGSTSTLTVSNGNAGIAPATLATPIQGNIALVKSGSGNQVLTGNNSYSAGTTISNGTLTAASANALGSGTVTLSGGTLAPSAPTTLSGFGGFQLNHGGSGNAANISNNILTLTDGSGGQANSAFASSPVYLTNKGGFSTSFLYSPSSTNNGLADGITFTIQNDPRGATALGSAGSSLGYGATGAIASSGSVQFEIYPFAPNGDGTGFATNGSITNPYHNISPIAFGTLNGVQSNNNFEPIQVTLAYDGVGHTLTESLLGLNSGGTYSIQYPGVDFNSLLGGNSGYVGFTGGSGGASALQTISNFTFAGYDGTPQNLSNDIVAAAGTSSGIQLSAIPGSNTTTLANLTLNANSTVSVTNVGGSSNTQAVLVLSSLMFSDTTGKIDLTTNELITTATPASIRDRMFGGQIITSAPGGALGYKAINGSQTEIRFTLLGDSDLDGTVNVADLANLAGNFGVTSGATWIQGDFDYNGSVNVADLADLAGNFGQTLSSSSFAAAATASPASLSAAAGSAAVPEPTTLTLLGLCALTLPVRRKRRR